MNMYRWLLNSKGGERGLFDESFSLDKHIVTIFSGIVCIVHRQEKDKGDVITQ